MVTTENIKLTKVAYFKILLILYLMRRWWILVFILVIMGLAIDKNPSTRMFMTIFLIIYPFAVALQLWRFVSSRENRGFYLEVYHEIDNEEFRSYLQDGSHSVIKHSFFIKAREISNRYLLYTSTNQFLIIPKTAFKTEDDRVWFERNIYLSLK